MIRAIFFDFAGVLFSIGDFEHSSLPDELGLDREKFTKITERFDESGKISDQKFISIVAEKFGISTSYLRKRWLEIYRKNGKLNKDIYRIAFALKKAGYKVGILSNAKKMHADINRENHAYDGFYPVILSYSVGCAKPYKKIFQIAFKRAHTKPEEIVFIDDRIVNVKGARAFGMKAILYKNPKQLKRELKKFRLKF